MGSERVGELLNETPDIADRPGARPLPARVAGAIRLHDVSFREAFEGGTHAHLMEKGGLYSALSTLQEAGMPDPLNR